MSTKLIRRFLIASGLFLGAAAAFSPAAFADTVNIGGTVAPILSLTTTPEDTNNDLDLDGEGTAGEHIVKVANLAVVTNNEQGLTFTVSSGSLAKSGGTSIPFQVTTVAEGGAAATDNFTVASGTNYTHSTGAGTVAANTKDRDLYIKYTPAALQDPGIYAGSMSVTVADN